MKLTYSDFIFTVTSKSLNIQEVPTDGCLRETYSIRAWDGGEVYECTIDEAEEVLDYKTKYRESINKKIYPIESLTQWIKVRPRRMAGDLDITFIYFTTSTVLSLDSGGDSNFSISVNESGTITCIDFCPAFDYEVGGGGLRSLTDLTDKSLKFTFIGAPDIPFEYGGNIKFVKNKKFVNSVDSYIMDNIDPKLIRYNSQYPMASKLRLEITHTAFEHINLEYYLVTSINL